jgi:hypothetical protein
MCVLLLVRVSIRICAIFDLVLHPAVLQLDMFVKWFRPFLADGWSVFDFFCVSMSLISLFTNSSGEFVHIFPTQALYKYNTCVSFWDSV